MALAVVIDDYISEKNIYLVFLSQDISDVIEAWTDPTKFFTEVKRDPKYNKYSKWSELSIFEWKYLLINKMSEFLKLTKADQVNEENSIVSNLHFYLIGLVHKFQIETGNTIELLRIQKINDLDYIINMNSVDMIKVSNTDPRKPILKVLDGI